MIGALYNGLSGVTSSSKGVNVTSNNIANVNTLGYKADTMQFARMMYDNSTGVGATGSGVGTMEVLKDFDQGELRPSSSFYDFAIDGKGFFAVNDKSNEDIYYTRAGNFNKSSEGFLVDNNGFNVMGMSTQIFNTSGDAKFDASYVDFIASKNIGTEDFTISINARSDDFSNKTTEIGTSGNNYKTKGTLLADIEVLKTNYNNKLSQYASTPNADAVSSTNQKVEITFGDWENDLSKDSSYIQLYVGNSLYRQNFQVDALTTMNLLADKVSNIPGFSASFDEPNSLLTIDNLVPGKNTPIDLPLGDYTSPIITQTAAIEGSGIAMINSARDALKDRIELANGNFLEIQSIIPAPNQANAIYQDIDLKLDSLGFYSSQEEVEESVRSTIDNDWSIYATQRGLDVNDTIEKEKYVQTKIAEKAFVSAEVTFEATDDGILLMSHQGNSYIVGRLSTVYFPDPMTLNPEGGNLYSETIDSGEPKNADLINTIHTKFVEMSNINLATGFTDIVRTQRAFEASSKAITTSDDFLKTAIQLKK